MKMMRAMAMMGMLVGAASCAPKPAPEPEAPPAPRHSEPLPRPTPAPRPPEPAIGWEDMALTPGDWVYREEGPSAVYGAGLFTVRCDRQARRIALIRSGTSGTLVIRTSYGARSLPGGPGGAAVPANDPFLDQMVFSRGRIAIEAEGQARLVLPTWAEPARVVDECRG
jgi:hypothetical protein